MRSNEFRYWFFAALFLHQMSSFMVLRSYSDDLFIHLSDKCFIAQEEFKEIYFDLLDKDFFSEDEKKSLLCSLSGSIVKNIRQTGPVLLSLIEWGQKNKHDDLLVQTLLHKLDRFFYFTFRNFVNEIDIEKMDEGKIYCLLHEFYKFKISTEDSSSSIFKQSVYPFRTVLSKAIIFILIVNSTNLSYKEKIKHSVYYLDKIKRELFEIKKALTDCTISDIKIDEFIEILQVYSVAEPLLKTSFLKKIFTNISIVFACTMVIILVVYFSLPHLIEPVRAYSNDLAKKMETVVAKTEGYKNGFLDYLEGHWYTRWAVGSRNSQKKESVLPNSSTVGMHPEQPDSNKGKKWKWPWG